MTLTADLFFSFRSPYSYLGVGRYRALAEEYDLDLRFRPVYPIAIRTPEFFKKVNPLWPPYLKRDVHRVAAFMGIPFVWPDPDPVVMDMKTLTIAAEQPYIHRLTFLGVAAARRGKGLAFADEVMRLIWGGTGNWHLAENLGPAVARAGLDLAELDGESEGSFGESKAEIGENQGALEKAGHWGVPTLVFEGEPFFGQDRIDLAVWTMRKKGLAKRA